ncbi:hypothetical protein ACFUAC_03100 [Streptomyces sp. NPDC057148]|uniref:hypothetical protein n=1 Tax=unclassified Streptomyces TaxID=2593676 RepID=UPI00362AC209
MYEDLGVQQASNSTLVSYLSKLTRLLTGNLAKPGAMQPHAWPPAGPLHHQPAPYPRHRRADAGGLVPCNVIAEEILTDHPDRFRAMTIESSNPAHSLADSAAFAKALAALDMVVVIDIALTEHLPPARPDSSIRCPTACRNPRSTPASSVNWTPSPAADSPCCARRPAPASCPGICEPGAGWIRPGSRLAPDSPPVCSAVFSEEQYRPGTLRPGA